MSEKIYDAIIIGGGVVGAAVARSLSRYELSVCLLEKEEDVCSGTSKANSAIVHAGFDALPGTQKAKFNVKGNAMMDKLSEELSFEFKRNGSLVLCFSDEDMPSLGELYRRAGEQSAAFGRNGGAGDLLYKAAVGYCDAAVLGDDLAVFYACYRGIAVVDRHRAGRRRCNELDVFQRERNVVKLFGHVAVGAVHSVVYSGSFARYRAAFNGGSEYGVSAHVHNGLIAHARKGVARKVYRKF